MAELTSETEVTAVALCQARGCEKEARMAVKTVRPTRGEMKTTVWYDDREARGGAIKYCKEHGVELVADLARALVSE